MHTVFTSVIQKLEMKRMKASFELTLTAATASYNMRYFHCSCTRTQRAFLQGAWMAAGPVGTFIFESMSVETGASHKAALENTSEVRGL